MALVVKRIKGRQYYYSFLSYFLIDRSKGFSKYAGTKKPRKKELNSLENRFRDEIIKRLSGKLYTCESISKDEIIKTLLFRDLFDRRYRQLTEAQRRRYDIDSTVLFTLTTLTTEDVDVSIEDVRNALESAHHLTKREQISRNMLNAVESIKKPRTISKSYLLELHKIAMASFETKNPGRIRDRQVYLYRASQDNPLGREIAYRPPAYNKVEKLLNGFVEWYSKSRLNPIEKATVAHYKLYKIHPFLDGNKRVCRLVFNKTLIDEKFPLLNVSMEKERYFDALIDSVEVGDAKKLIKFVLGQYYKQVRGFLAGIAD